MKTFFKKLGITMVPILVALLVAIIVRLAMNSAFKVMHPSVFSGEVYECCIAAMWYVILSSIIVCWVFVSLMDWRKKKLIAMAVCKLVKSCKEDHSGDNNENEGQRWDNHPASPAEETNVKIWAMRQEWYRTTRFVFCGFFYSIAFGSVQLDIPTKNEKEIESFWRDCDAFIYALFVGDIIRKNCMGGALLNAAEGKAKKQGCKTVALRWDDRESEPWVLDWYKRKGYEEIREEEDGHCHFLVKQLASPSSSSSSSEEEQPESDE